MSNSKNNCILEAQVMELLAKPTEINLMLCNGQKKK